MSNFLNSIKARRTIYAIGNNVALAQDKIEEIKYTESIIFFIKISKVG